MRSSSSARSVSRSARRASAVDRLDLVGQPADAAQGDREARVVGERQPDAVALDPAEQVPSGDRRDHGGRLVECAGKLRAGECGLVWHAGHGAHPHEVEVLADQLGDLDAHRGREVTAQLDLAVAGQLAEVSHCPTSLDGVPRQPRTSVSVLLWAGTYHRDHHEPTEASTALSSGWLGMSDLICQRAGAGAIRRADDRAYGSARPTAAAMAARSARAPVWRVIASAAWAQSMPSPSTAAAAPTARAAATRPCACGPEVRA